MRKITTIAFILFIGVLTSQAQVTVSPGIKGGLTLSRLTNIDDNGLKSDFYAGGLVAIKFNKYFTLQPEITYSRQGSEGRYYSEQNPDFGTRAKYELNYLSLDAVAKFHFGGQGFHILAGPSADFKTSDNFGRYGFDPIDFDFSIIAGVGYSLPNGLTFEARFKQGFVDIYGYDGLEYDDDKYYYEDLILNQVFQIGISYTFKVK